MNTENKAETAKKIEVMQASLDGKVIQWRPRGNAVWFTFQPCETMLWNWEANEYRVRREPRRKRTRLANVRSRIENLKVGQVYTLHDPSPFSTDDITATIVDIKDGYVQYKLPSGGLSDCTTRTFVNVYNHRIK